MKLDVDMNKDTGIMNVTVSGDLDANQRKELKQKLESTIETDKPDKVIIDCTDLNYIDSTGLGVLVSAMNKVKTYGGTIKITNLKPYLQKIFRVTGLMEIFEIGDAE